MARHLLDKNEQQRISFFPDNDAASQSYFIYKQQNTHINIYNELLICKTRVTPYREPSSGLQWKQQVTKNKGKPIGVKKKENKPAQEDATW